MLCQISKGLNIRVIIHLIHLARFNADRPVVGWKGPVESCHHAADTRCSVSKTSPWRIAAYSPHPLHFSAAILWARWTSKPSTSFFRSILIGSLRLILVQLVPLIIDQLKQDTIHLFRMDKGEFAVPERPGTTDEWITFSL